MVIGWRFYIIILKEEINYAYKIGPTWSLLGLVYYSEITNWLLIDWLTDWLAVRLLFSKRKLNHLSEWILVY